MADREKNRTDEPLPGTGGGTLDEEAAGALAQEDYRPFSLRHPWVRYLRYLWLLLLIPVGYVCIQMVFILSPNVSTATAIDHTMTDFTDIGGVVATRSTPIFGGGGGVVYYTVEPGQWVSADTPVAELYATQEAAEARAEIDRINMELQQLQTAQRTTSEGVDANLYMQQMVNGIHDLRSVTDSLDYSNLNTAMEEVALANNKYQIATGQVENFQTRIDVLMARRAALQAQAVPTGSILMEKTGFFMPAAKYDRVPYDIEALQEATPEELASLLAAQPAYSEEGIVGYVVEEYKWFLFITVGADEVVKYVPGNSVHLMFPEWGSFSLPAKVEAVEQNEEMSAFKITISSEQVTPELLQLRAENARVVFRIESGLRIDRDALRIIDGQTGVYIKFGNNAYFRHIEILLEDEKYILISGTYKRGVNEVQRFDEVIVDTGGMELYDGKIL